jgi:hypothetical protein
MLARSLDGLEDGRSRRYVLIRVVVGAGDEASDISHAREK